jgi:hypothetical protein
VTRNPNSFQLNFKNGKMEKSYIDDKGIYLVAVCVLELLLPKISGYYKWSILI